MTRTIWKNQDKSNQDLTAEDFSNAYFFRCNFTNCEFRLLTNATFIECDLTNTDLSNCILNGVSIKNCIGVETIQFRTINTINKIGKVLLDKFGLGAVYPLHAHGLIAALIKKETVNYPLAVKDKCFWIADYIASHPEYSWDAFAQLIVAKWSKKALSQMIEAAFANYPMLLSMGRTMVKKYG